MKLGKFAGRLIELIVILLIIVALILIIMLVIEFNQKPDPTSTGFVESKSQEFVQSQSTRLPAGQSLHLKSARQSVQDPGWLLLTIFRQDPKLSQARDVFGLPGLVAIGHFQGGRWAFQIEDDSPRFDRWLTTLPNDLLAAENKEGFRHYLPEAGSSVGLEGADHLFQETPACNLPYPKGQEYVITALPGEFAHTGLTKEAVDFGMPEGALISFGCEKGIVVDFKDSSNNGGCDPRLDSKANFIKIETTPGQDLLYLHLQVNSISAQGIRKGQEVTAGQIIGKAGSTGFTCNFSGSGPAPHLHIVLEKRCSGRVCGSLPLRFTELRGGSLQKGVRYKSENKSLRERAAEARAQEQQRQLRERENIERTLDFFHAVFACSAVVDCDRSKIITTYITQGMYETLFPDGACFGCPLKWEKVEITADQHQPFLAPATDQTRLTTTSKEQWLTEYYQGIYTQNTVVAHHLIKEGGIWKIDSYEIVSCTYSVEPKEGWVPDDLIDCERVDQTDLK